MASASAAQASAPLEEPATGAVNNTLRAYQEIRRQILADEMPAGSQHLEQDLAERLKMSRTPVREALIRLAEEKLVEIRPRHGVRVLPISLKDMAEIYEVLTELEALAARRAAESGLAPDELASLDAAVAAMDDALQKNDLIAWSQADADFHARLIAAGGNARLETAVRMCLDQVHRARRYTLNLRPKPKTSNDDHRAVVAAIRARDATRAHTIHHRHREQAGRLLLSLLSENGKTEV
ncbi:MAG: GntR family transcriptional regulator [Hyphomicrobiaceae bacterium]|nr:GntR family transcriptional regulator [Hyphomicrobiaceae bacterium]